VTRRWSLFEPWRAEQRPVFPYLFVQLLRFIRDKVERVFLRGADARVPENSSEIANMALLALQKARQKSDAACESEGELGYGLGRQVGAAISLDSTISPD
jgi:hypothetical protein